MVTPVAITTIGWQYYIVFAVIAGCIAPSVYFLFPETMGRSLEEIELVFKESTSPWSTVQLAKTRKRVEPEEILAKEKAIHVESRS